MEYARQWETMASMVVADKGEKQEVVSVFRM